MMDRNYVYEIGQHLNIKNFHGTILDHVILKRGNETGYKYKCDKCGQINLQSEYNIKYGIGCPVCANRKIVEGINDIPTTDPWLVDFFQGGYEEAKLYHSHSTKKIVPKCPFCGEIRKKEIAIEYIRQNHGFRCPCKDGISFPNKFIFNVLKQLKNKGLIKSFDKEYQIPYKNSYKYYDGMFVLNNDKKYLVEMDGGIGHGNTQKKSYLNYGKVSEENDKIKDSLAIEYGFEIIRIDSKKSDLEYIKKNMLKNDVFKNILKVEENIDWNETLLYCINNMVKVICDYKKNNPECFASEASQIFGVSDVTVRNYWKMGNILGFCEYSPATENLRKNLGHYYQEPWVYICVDLDDADEVYWFSSYVEFENKSKELLGEKVSRERIRKKVKTVGFNQWIKDDGFDYIVINNRR